VVGSAGSTVLSGPAIRARLRLRDSWFTFVRVSTNVQPARSARPLSWGPVFTEPVLEGEFTPAPRRRLVVERRSDDRWRKVTRLRTADSGRYRLDVERPGVYRVRAGRVAGPSVRVR
jgi:hypothetical protein